MHFFSPRQLNQNRITMAAKAATTDVYYALFSDLSATSKNLLKMFGFLKKPSIQSNSNPGDDLPKKSGWMIWVLILSPMSLLPLRAIMSLKLAPGGMVTGGAKTFDLPCAPARS